MEQLLAKLTGATYDLVGIVFPGLVGLVVWIGLLFAIGTDGTSVILRVADWVDVHEVSAVLVVGTCGYFSGLFLRWLSRGYLWHWLSFVPKGAALRLSGREPMHFSEGRRVCRPGAWRRWLRFLTFQQPYQPEPNHSASMTKAQVEAQAKLSRRLQVKEDMEWRAFYMVAKNFVAQSTSRSQIPTYQNKYTFHRSLAVAFSIATWEAIYLAGLLAQRGDWEGGLFSLLLALGAGLLVFLSCLQFEANWRFLGDAVIAETIVACRDGK